MAHTETCPICGGRSGTRPKKLPRERLSGDGLSIIDALYEAGLAETKSVARRIVTQGGAYANNRRVDSVDARLGPDDLVSESMVVLRSGKKRYALLQFGGGTETPIAEGESREDAMPKRSTKRPDLIDFIDTHPATGSFSPVPHYFPDGDFISVYFTEERCYSVRVNDQLTVYRSMETDAIVGCKIKGVRRLLEAEANLQQRLEQLEGG